MATAIIAFSRVGLAAILAFFAVAGFSPDMSGVVTPQMFGAEFSGPASGAKDTAAFQAALNTGRTVHFPGLKAAQQFTPTTCLSMTTPHQIIYGDGELTSLVTVNPSPSLLSPSKSCAGVLVSASLSNGPDIRDLGIIFGQPSEPRTQADLYSYVPAFYLRSTPQFHLSRISCLFSTVCIDMKSNSGNSVVEDLKYNAFKIGIDVDGSLDTNVFIRIHFFPYGMTRSMYKIFINQGECKITAGYRNHGNGRFEFDPFSNPLNFSQSLPQIGTYKSVFDSANSFGLYDPSGVLVTRSSVGKNVRNQLNFSITEGTRPFEQADEFDITVSAIPPIGLNMARMDGYHISDSLFGGGIGVNMYQTGATLENGNSGGYATGTMEGVDFDSASGITMSQGEIRGQNLSFSSYPRGSQPFDFEGGVVELDGLRVLTSRTEHQPPLFHLGGSGGSFTIGHAFWALGSMDVTAVYQDMIGGSAGLDMNVFQHDRQKIYFRPLVEVKSGHITLIGNRAYDLGSGRGTFLSMIETNDPFSALVGNAVPGWKILLPTAFAGTYVGNK